MGFVSPFRQLSPPDKEEDDVSIKYNLYDVDVDHELVERMRREIFCNSVRVFNRLGRIISQARKKLEKNSSCPQVLAVSSIFSIITVKNNSEILPKKLGKNYPPTLGNITEQYSEIVPKNYSEIMPDYFFYRNRLPESSESLFPKHTQIFIIGYRGIWHR